MQYNKRIIVSLVLFFASMSFGAAIESIPEKIVIKDWLIAKEPSKSFNKLFNARPMTFSIVTDSFEYPEAGDELIADSENKSIWIEAQAGDNGVLKHEYMKNGWACATVNVEQKSRAILRAKGHVSVSVNGVARVMNIFRYNYVMIPVVLEKGENHLFFKCKRYGTVEAFLEPVTSDVIINMDDATLPEAVRDRRASFDAGIVVVNTTTEFMELSKAQGKVGNDSVRLPDWRLPPLGIAKVPVKLPAKKATGKELLYKLEGELFEPAEIRIPIVGPEEFRKVTFISKADGSVQYYALRPPIQPNNGGPFAMMMYLHGASDEASGYRNVYYGKPWCAITSPTNRRPFGFGWEGLGRIDAMEVLAHSKTLIDTDPYRVYLGGHSMGGHGVWQVGGHYPDKFAAVGPGAGWEDIWSYTSTSPCYMSTTDTSELTELQELLKRCPNPSRTSLLVNNHLQHGVLIIHGDADSCVPISEANRMHKLLTDAGHKDLTMIVEPGGEHVFDSTPEIGKSCFDSLELFDFYQKHMIPIAPRRVDFTTISPAISDWCHWARLEQQIKQLAPSRVILQIDPGRRWLFGTLENVQRFTIKPSTLMEPGEITIQLNNEEERKVQWSGGLLHFELTADGYELAQPLNLSQKGPHRAGTVASIVEQNHPIFVIGTNGTDQENRWALEKARLNSETMWYRGNVSYEIIFDSEFETAKYPDRNIILYGNSKTNSAWSKLLWDSPIQVFPGKVMVGKKTFIGDNISSVFIRPRKDSDTACVAAISGTGIVGMRSSIPGFFGRSFVPDFIVYNADVWKVADDAVLAAGMFANDWTIDSADTVFEE